MKIKKVHISEVKPGDTVIHNGLLRTVCANNLTHDKFMGRLLFGDSYQLGQKLVSLATELKY